MIPGYIQEENKREMVGKGHSTMEMTFSFHMSSKVLNFKKSSSEEILRNLFRVTSKCDTACHLR